jgi:hypothetical protein
MNQTRETNGIQSNGIVTWEGDIQLTRTNADSILPSLGVNGETIHVAWIDQREGSGNNEIYYKRSTDRGLTWADPDTRISFNPADSIRPAFAVNGNSVHLFWRDTRDGNYELYYRRSTDGGNTWTPESRTTQDPGYSGCPFPVIHGSTVYLFWRDDRLGTFKIFFKRSDDHGVTWGPDTLLTPDGIKAEFPYPIVQGNSIHLVWRDTRDGNAEIYYKRSINGGINWTKDERLTYNSGESEHPKLAVLNDSLFLVWRDDRDGNYEIYLKKSVDDGKTWSADQRLTNTRGPSLWPVIVGGDSTLHLLWADTKDEVQGLYYMFSIDEGNNWNNPTKISNCIAVSGLMGAHPMVVNGSYIHVVFNDKRNGYNQIYYKRGSISS